MKLVRVEVKNYRSLFHDYDKGESFSFELADGVNSITGPNNSGKSNVLRALALALDPDFEFNRSADMPAVFEKWSKPVVTLTFHVPSSGAPSAERTLLKRLEKYERQVQPDSTATYASAGEVRLRVTIELGKDSRGVRYRTFVAKGAGAKKLGYDDETTLSALDQFDKCLQFVMIKSGESLDSLLQGRFRQVLETVLRDELTSEFAAAEKSRSDYIGALQTGVLASLRGRISEELVDLFPELTSVELEPSVRSLDDTLTSMRVTVEDVAKTDLADKGTGVRGGLIIAMLQHLASSSRRSVVFAVEEPESFLHPAAQEALRDDLESLAQRRDVSVLITTHSPFVVSRRHESQVVAVTKDDRGRTVVRERTKGSEPLLEAFGELFRDSLSAGFLDQASRAVANEVAVLVVEGETDKSWLELAAKVSNRPELIEGLTVVAAGGALSAVVQALVFQATSANPVAVLFDNDDEGKRCIQLMKDYNSKSSAWPAGKRVFSYRMVLNPNDHQFAYEAEDLWPERLHQGFLQSVGETGNLAEKAERPNPLGGFHYGYKPAAKGAFAQYVQRNARSADSEKWTEMLELIRSGLGI